MKTKYYIKFNLIKTKKNIILNKIVLTQIKI